MLDAAISALLDTGANVLSDLLDARFGLKALVQRDYPPRQTVRGYEYAQRDITAIHTIVAARNVMQDYQFMREPLIEHCQSLRELLAKHAKTTAPQALPRVHFKDLKPRDFVREFVYNPHPVVVSGFPHRASSWTGQGLISKYGHEDVPILNLVDGTQSVRKMGEMANHPEYYLANSDGLFLHYPELKAALNLEALQPYLGDFVLDAQNIFLSTTRISATPTHFGVNQNVFFQIRGKKRWRLVDPYYLALLYPVLKPIDGSTALWLLDDEDRRRCPLWAFCPHYEVTLEPGDLLFNPFYWFHAVLNESDETLAVATRWMGKPGRAFRDPCPLFTGTSALSYGRAQLMYRQLKARHAREEFCGYDTASHNRMWPTTHEECAQAWGVPAWTPSAMVRKALATLEPQASPAGN